MIVVPSVDLRLAACAMLFALSLWRGATPERLLSGGLLVTALLEQHDEAVLGWTHSYLAKTCGDLLLEVALFAWICAFALRANRIYPLWMGGAQIIVLASHAMHIFLGEKTAPGSAAIERFGDAAAIIAMATGLCSHILRQQRFGRGYAAWTRDPAQSSRLDTLS